MRLERSSSAYEDIKFNSNLPLTSAAFRPVDLCDHVGCRCKKIRFDTDFLWVGPFNLHILAEVEGHAVVGQQAAGQDEALLVNVGGQSYSLWACHTRHDLVLPAVLGVQHADAWF